MIVKRNWFMNLSLFLFAIGVLLASTISFFQLGREQDTFRLQVLFIAFIIAAFGCLYLCGNIFECLQKANRFSKRNIQTTEFVAIMIAFSLGLFLRIVCVIKLPVTPQSDFALYYNFAAALSKGQPGPQSYVAVFPHVFGYPWFLSIIFRIFGVSLNAAIGFNVILSMATCFIVWSIAKQLGGVMSGLIALFTTMFWPSQIIYGNTVGSEFLFTFLLLLCVRIFLLQFTASKKSAKKTLVSLVSLGALLAIADAVRPMARIFLIASILTLFVSKNAVPLAKDDALTRFLSKGWKRAVIILCSYLLVSSCVTLYISHRLDVEPASGVSSFGYNLLVGLNVETSGCWSAEIEKFFNEAQAQTGSATKAHFACLEKAFETLPTRSLNDMVTLFLKKFAALWGNDNYGVAWNLEFMDDRSNALFRSNFAATMYGVSNFYYLAALVFSAPVFFKFRKCGLDATCSVTLSILGFMALHLFVESQNRYHYSALNLFAILCGIGISYAIKRKAIISR